MLAPQPSPVKLSCSPCSHFSTVPWRSLVGLHYPELILKTSQQTRFPVQGCSTHPNQFETPPKAGIEKGFRFVKPPHTHSKLPEAGLYRVCYEFAEVQQTRSRPLGSLLWVRRGSTNLRLQGVYSEFGGGWTNQNLFEVLFNTGNPAFGHWLAGVHSTN